MNDILKIAKSLEHSGLLLKGVSETTRSEAKNQKGAFLSMLLGTHGASLLGNILADKGVTGAGEGTSKVGYGSMIALGLSTFKKKSKKLLIIKT